MLDTDLTAYTQQRTDSEQNLQLNQIYDAMENLLDEKAVQRKWDEREEVGFKK